MSRQAAQDRHGFTLIEILVSIAIIALLAGLAYAGLAPVRERARETHCLNNLHQIARAMQMYRQDFGGQDPPGALTAAQLGLPTEPRLLLPYLGGNWRVFQCPSEYWGVSGGTAAQEGLGARNRRNPVSYVWHIFPDNFLPLQAKKFSDRVELRGNDMPIVLDPHHGGMPYGDVRDVRFIILRLGGQVQIRTFPKLPRSTWQL
jgi:prepilin-type N-terminal cleavage/methylation domain-containing protein